MVGSDSFQVFRVSTLIRAAAQQDFIGAPVAAASKRIRRVSSFRFVGRPGGRSWMVLVVFMVLNPLKSDRPVHDEHDEHDISALWEKWVFPVGGKHHAYHVYHAARR